MPSAYDAALHHQWTILHLEHAMYFLPAACSGGRSCTDSARAAAKAVYVFAAFVLGSPLGLLLALLPSAVYGFYEHGPRLWGLSPLADQQIAGVTMASEQAIVFFAALAFMLVRFFEERGTFADRVPRADR